MKLVQINATCGIGSTGKICVAISKLLNEKNIENYILFSCKTDGYGQGIQCSSENYIRVQALKSKIFGNYGFNSKNATKKIVSELEKIKPDIVHLHNVHGHDCNLLTLCEYLKAKKIKVYWTFHDCWAFTGYCPHFLVEKCNCWQTECHNCNVKSNYSWFFDRSTQLYNKKKQAISGMDLTIITPSQWLAGIVQQSFLKDVPVKIINNGINLNVFKPTESDFRAKYQLGNKKIVLGVAFGWGKKKGLDVFIDLSKRLPRDFRIVLVGTDAEVDKQLPPDIISIHKTGNQRELAEIYTVADIYVNPTREDTYPTVNMEAIACGTPVVTFNTGGSAEMIDATCGAVVECDDIDALEYEVRHICERKNYYLKSCLEKAKAFDMNDRFKEYILLYK